MTPGAVIGVVAFVAVTVGLRPYVADVGSYRTYGSLVAIVITLMWCHLTAIAGLIGAAVDVARGRVRSRPRPLTQPSPPVGESGRSSLARSRDRSVELVDRCGGRRHGSRTVVMMEQVG